MIWHLNSKNPVFKIQDFNIRSNCVFNNFFSNLYHQKWKNSKIRVMHYGDSQIECDRITSYIRNKLQIRFKGMGPGLLPAIQPYGSFFSIDQINTGNWKRFTVFGKVDTTSPDLYLEDFVIALRNAWWKYASLKGYTYYYSAPGCSIDPNPKTIQKLQQVGGKILSTSGEVESSLKQWHAICSQPQKVRVLGIPFDSRFAKVMVDADYYMKE